MRTLIGRAAACAVLLIGLQAGVSGQPASAADKDGTCDDGEMCFWRDGNFQGCLYDTNGANEDDHLNFKNVKYNTCSKISLDNSMTSYVNKKKTYVVVYENAGTTGFRYCIQPGKSGNVIGSFNDKASSYAGYPSGVDEAQNCDFVDRD